jgi:hypothetical protein
VFRLHAGTIDCVPLGAHVVKGRSTEVNVFRAVAARPVRSRLEAAIARGLAPLAGRQRELDVLEECWNDVAAGRGRLPSAGLT